MVEADVGETHAVADDGEDEREVGQGTEDPAAAAREPEHQRGRGRLERDTGENHDPVTPHHHIPNKQVGRENKV